MEKEMKIKEKLRGFSGWLEYYIVMLVLTVAGFLLFTFIFFYGIFIGGEKLDVIGNIIFFCIVAFTVLLVSILITTLKRKKEAIKYNMLLNFILFAFYFLIGFNFAFRDGRYYLLLPPVVHIIAAFYWKRSKRVKNTFVK